MTIVDGSGTEAATVYKGPDKRCGKCRYWRGLSADGIKACHFLLDNGRSRERDGDRCLSFDPGQKKKTPPVRPRMVPAVQK